MHLTQPAISKRVAQIEQQLGALLFDRIGPAVRPTEASNSLATSPAEQAYGAYPMS